MVKNGKQWLFPDLIMINPLMLVKRCHKPSPSHHRFLYSQPWVVYGICLHALNILHGNLWFPVDLPANISQIHWALGRFTEKCWEFTKQWKHDHVHVVLSRNWCTWDPNHHNFTRTSQWPSHPQPPSGTLCLAARTSPRTKPLAGSNCKDLYLGSNSNININQY